MNKDLWYMIYYFRLSFKNISSLFLVFLLLPIYACSFSKRLDTKLASSSSNCSSSVLSGNITLPKEELELLRAYLTIDVQKGAESIRDILLHIKKIQDGSLADWERNGNAYILRLSDGKARILEEYGRNAGKTTEFKLDIFAQAVEDWKTCVLTCEQKVLFLNSVIPQKHKELLRAYLSWDIQRSPAWIKELSEKIVKVKNGTLASWERQGNAFLLIVKPRSVLIVPDNAEDDKAQIDMDIFEQGLKDWRSCVLRP